MAGTGVGVGGAFVGATVVCCVGAVVVTAFVVMLDWLNIDPNTLQAAQARMMTPHAMTTPRQNLLSFCGDRCGGYGG